VVSKRPQSQVDVLFSLVAIQTDKELDTIALLLESRDDVLSLVLSEQFPDRGCVVLRKHIVSLLDSRVQNLRRPVAREPLLDQREALLVDRLSEARVHEDELRHASSELFQIVHEEAIDLHND